MSCNSIAPFSNNCDAIFSGNIIQNKRNPMYLIIDLPLCHKYIYCGTFSLDNYESSEFFDFLHAVIKLELEEVVNHLKNITKLML